MIIGKIASPNENPRTDIEVALPLFCPNQRPIATEGKWNNIPWPKNLNPKIIPINIQRDELNTIAKHKIDKKMKTNISNFLNSYLSTNPPKTNIIKAEAKVPNA